VQTANDGKMVVSAGNKMFRLWEMQIEKYIKYNDQINLCIYGIFENNGHTQYLVLIEKQ
jgi:hypothetical protein